jgi:PHD/YefM family antitoxin component YafN of YafNO toxin-antitoxin module
MVDINNIRSLSDFQRNAREHIRRLKRTGKPEVLTVNGKAALVVQSAEAYQSLLEAADLANTVAVLRDRIEAADRGQEVVSADNVLAEIRAKLGIREQP